MAYVPQDRILKLVFRESDLEGLEVRATSVTTGAFLGIGDLATVDVQALIARAPTREEMAQARNLFETFAMVLLDWNIEQPAGTPVAATLDGILSLDIALGLRIVYSWMDAIAGSAFPTRESIDDRAMEETLPVEVLAP